MSKKIKFVSYSGAYPNLCSGKLVVNIDGKEVSFGCTNRALVDSDEKVAKYHSFWESGGNTHCIDGHWFQTCGEWKFSEDLREKDYPSEIWNSLEEILEVMRKNVENGCCGGCL